MSHIYVDLIQDTSPRYTTMSIGISTWNYPNPTYPLRFVAVDASGRKGGNRRGVPQWQGDNIAYFLFTSPIERDVELPALNQGHDFGFGCLPHKGP